MSCGFLDETWSRNLVNLMVSPLPEVELLAGLMVVSAALLVASPDGVAEPPPVDADPPPVRGVLVKPSVCWGGHTSARVDI